MIKRILYHDSQINPISNILTDEFKYERKTYCGMGIYLSDIIDYISFNRRDNFGKTVSINSTFSFIASEVFYDNTKFKQINDMNLNAPELDHFPSYNEIKQKYPNKIVEPNGIHFIRLNNEGNSITENMFDSKVTQGELLGNEYVITEKYQILPIYSITLRRNEYFILWRDPNFKGVNDFSEYLQYRKLFCTEKSNMNIYFESSTEEALKFLFRRQYNKVILITSIGLDLSGKRFVDVARKIFGFNLIVLFFSVNENHLKWIKNYPNCLYTNTSQFYEEYISNFNEKGLINLKKKIEERYKITLMDFSKDFLSYPNFKNEEDFSCLNFMNKNNFIRHVKICCKINNLFLNMSLYGEVSISQEENEWDITIVNNEITFFSNGFYLDVENDIVIGKQYMKIWNFKKVAKGFYFFTYPGKKENNILSAAENIIKVNKSKIGKSEQFKLIDVIEE